MRYRVLVLRDSLLSAGLPECDFRAERPVWGEPLDANQSARADAIVAEVLAAFPDPAINDEQWEAWEAAESDREIDAVPDSVVDLILAAKALPPNATAAEVRARAKANRRPPLPVTPAHV